MIQTSKRQGTSGIFYLINYFLFINQYDDSEHISSFQGDCNVKLGITCNVVVPFTDGYIQKKERVNGEPIPQSVL